jgi:hypothetical protein
MNSTQEHLLNDPATKERILKMVEDAKAYHQAISTFKLMTHSGTHKGFVWVTDDELRKNKLCWEDGRIKQIAELPCDSCAKKIEYLLQAPAAVSGFPPILAAANIVEPK